MQKPLVSSFELDIHNIFTCLTCLIFIVVAISDFENSLVDNREVLQVWVQHIEELFIPQVEQIAVNCLEYVLSERVVFLSITENMS